MYSIFQIWFHFLNVYVRERISAIESKLNARFSFKQVYTVTKKY